MRVSAVLGLHKMCSSEWICKLKFAQLKCSSILCSSRSMIRSSKWNIKHSGTGREAWLCIAFIEQQRTNRPLACCIHNTVLKIP